MVLFLEFVAFSILLGFILSLFKEWRRAKSALNLPPSPWSIPVIGSMHHFIGPTPHYTLRKLAQKLGPIVHLQIGQLSMIVVSSPHLAKEIMKTHDLAFANRGKYLSTKILWYDATSIATGSYGDFWRQMRKICTIELLGAKRVRSFSSIRQDEASHLVESIRALATAGEPVDLTEKLFDYTCSVLCRAAYGKNISKEEQKEFLLLVDEAGRYASTWDISDVFPSYKFLHVFSGMKASLMKVHLEMDKILDILIDRHVSGSQLRMTNAMGEYGQEDLIDVLLRVQECGDLQFPITKTNIKGVLLVS